MANMANIKVNNNKILISFFHLFNSYCVQNVKSIMINKFQTR